MVKYVLKREFCSTHTHTFTHPEGKGVQLTKNIELPENAIGISIIPYLYITWGTPVRDDCVYEVLWLEEVKGID